MSLNDAHGDILGAIASSLANKIELSLTLSK
jgi:hypothetical protein